MNLRQWKKGCVLHPVKLWVAVTQRRVPKLFVAPRASEVVIKVYIKGDWVWFEETKVSVEKVRGSSGVQPLTFYKHRYLMPEKVSGQDLLEYLRKKPLYIFAEPIYSKMYCATNPQFR